MTEPESEVEGLTDFLYEMGLLKQYRRTGWWVAGVGDPESIAEHSFRTAVIGYLLAVLEGADPARTAALCLFHDTQETRIGDVPLIGKGYVATTPNPEVTADQVAGLPPRSGGPCATWSASTRPARPRARLAKDADKLECLLQAREYQAQGHGDVAAWIESSAAGLRSASARRLADACRRVPPRRWWEAVAGARARSAAPVPAGAAGRQGALRARRPGGVSRRRRRRPAPGRP